MSADPAAGELPREQPDLTSALRVGLEAHRPSVGTSGLSLGLPADVDPFDYYAGGAPAEVAAGPPVVAAAGPLPIDEMRVARMIQAMAVFGRSAGEAELHKRDETVVRYDYFA